MIDRPCKFAINPSGDCWECTCWRNTYCADQIFDINPDDTVNAVTCRLGYEQTERSE